MPTPVIIAAHNEERLIGRCLESLSSDVSPIVAANGCTDDTVRIAETFGADVIDIEAPGKLPAIQTALRTLGHRALEPVLYLDADSYPLHTTRWANVMTERVSGSDAPQAASGPLGYFDGNLAADIVRTLKRLTDVRKARRENRTLFWGNNMATRFDESTLEDVLTLPHIWPGEDRAIEMEVESHGGQSAQVTHPLSVVMTSSRFMLPISHIVRVGTDEARRENLLRYNERAAQGSIPLGRYMRQSKRRKARQR